jgi:hypothetical protein
MRILYDPDFVACYIVLISFFGSRHRAGVLPVLHSWFRWLDRARVMQAGWWTFTIILLKLSQQHKQRLQSRALLASSLVPVRISSDQY